MNDVPEARSGVPVGPAVDGRRRIDSVLRHREAVTESMAAEGIDAVLIGSQSNFFYCTGYHTPTWHMPGRPIFLVLGRDGAAFAVVNQAEAEQVTAGAVQVVAVPYTDPVEVRMGDLTELHHTEAALRVLVRLLGDLSAARVGVEMVGAPPSHTSPRIVDALRTEAQTSVVDVTLQLSRLRRVKDDVEVDGIRRASQVLGRTFETFEQHAAVGMTERDLSGTFLAAAAAAGADFVAYIAMRHTDGDLLGPATDRAWQAGSVLYADCGLCVDGYWADLSRHYVASDCSDAQGREYGVIVDALRRERAAVRPGARCAEVAEVVRSLLGDARYGRFGHGIGLQFLEPPSLASADMTLLEPGMTLCIEPIGTFPEAGELIAEEMVVVTDDGHELLSPPMPERLTVVV